MRDREKSQGDRQADARGNAAFGPRSAEYQAASRAKSPADFTANIGLVEKECDEGIYWTERLIEGGIIEEHLLRELMGEAHQFSAISVTPIRTARSRK